MIDADNLLGGESRRVSTRARNAIEQHLALPFGIAVTEAAERAVRGFEADVAEPLSASIGAALLRGELS